MISKLLEHSNEGFLSLYTWLIMQVDFRFNLTAIIERYYICQKRARRADWRQFFSQVSALILLCVSVVIRSFVKKAPKPEWNTHVSTSLCILLSSVQLDEPPAHKESTTRLESNLSSLKFFSLWSRFDMHVRVSIHSSCFCVCRCVTSGSGWDGKSFTVSADPFDSYQVNHQISAVP